MVEEGRLEGIFAQGYGLIPKLIMRDKDLTPEAKAIYCYLASFTGAGRTAYPSVSLMASELNMGVDRFYRHRKQLVEKDYIRISRHKNEGEWSNNVYTLTSKPYPQNKDTQNKDTQNKDTQNEGTIINSSIINSINNNSTNKEHSPAKAEPSIPYKKIIDHLNEKASRSFKHTTDKTKRLIEARFNEGFDEKDFEQVVDIKVAEWKETDMAKFLRPETLFGPKFEGYLNQPAPPTDRGNDYSDFDFFE